MDNQTEKIDSQIIHAIAGRIRLKNYRLKRDNNYAQEVQELVKSINGVTDVRISPETASIIVSYNPKSVDHKAFKTELANCFQQSKKLKNSTLVTTEEIKPETDTSDESNHETTPPIVEKIEQNLAKVLKSSSGIQIPKECLNQIDQFPVNVNQEREVFEIGIPAFCILQPLNSKLEEFATENEKHTESQIINLDFQASFIEEGLLINGQAKGKFREYFFTLPFTKNPFYSPWVSISAVGVAELDTSVVDETLNVNLSQLKISGKRGKWYKKLIDFGFENFFKAKLVDKINEFLAQFNGEKNSAAFLDIKGDERLRANSKELGMTSEKLDTLLSLVQVNVRVAPDYLWLSVKL